MLMGMESVIVTGGTRGIGKEIVSALCAKGLFVHVIARHRAPPGNTPSNTAFHQCDVSNAEEVRQFFETLSHDKSVIALVNNAGIYGDDHAEEIFHTNVLGAYYIT